MPDHSTTKEPPVFTPPRRSLVAGASLYARAAIQDGARAMPVDPDVAALHSAGGLLERDVRRPHWLNPEGMSPVRDVQYVAKRVTDLVGTLTLLIILSPLMLAIALAIRLNSRGPVIYKSARLGLGSRHFTCYKFRTMVDGADKRQQELEHRNDAQGPIFKLEDDPRVTRVGRMLRASALDELPQLFNVLAGQMSLVGPRPLPLRDCMELGASDHRRHSVYPGMTGLWQVEPHRHGPGSASIVDLDLRYIDGWSYWLDLRILLQTAAVVVRGKADPHGADEPSELRP